MPLIRHLGGRGRMTESFLNCNCFRQRMRLHSRYLLVMSCAPPLSALPPSLLLAPKSPSSSHVIDITLCGSPTPSLHPLGWDFQLNKKETVSKARGSLSLSGFGAQCDHLHHSHCIASSCHDKFYPSYTVS